MANSSATNIVRQSGARSVNLSFLTHSNQDEFVHKSFEIAGCGGFLLAERSEGHLQRFKEDEEAVFFSTFDELAAKIRRYLPDESARDRIAKAGNLRAARDGYHNDRQVQLIVERVTVDCERKVLFKAFLKLRLNLQEILNQLLPMSCQHALRMELYAFNG